MIVTIVGVGLIGGSLAKSLRASGFGSHFIGVDREDNASIALSLGLVDEVLPLKEASKQSDLVILSVPVTVAHTLLEEILDSAKASTVVVDMGSTKNGICTAIRNHPHRNQFVASHPIAGTEYSGPLAAIDGLFENKKTILCESELSAPFALERVIRMYNTIKMEIIYMSPDTHDRHIAYVSHLSHISSFALGLTVLNIEKDEKNILNMAGSGFSSTVRLAKSSPETWEPILMQNAHSVSFALDSYIKELQKFKNYIDENNSEDLKKLIKEANKIEKIIK